MKRKQPDPTSDDDDYRPVSTPKRQKSTATNGSMNNNQNSHAVPDEAAPTTPSKQSKFMPRRTNNTATPAPLRESGLKTPTQRAKAKALFTTPTKPTTVSTPTRARNADRSAKKKSARLLQEQGDEEDWDGADRLAEEILAEENGAPDSKADDNKYTGVRKSLEKETPTETKPEQTPKRRAGRPKGARNKRSPTPEGELPPHERYFFQNRAGPAHTSNNTLNKVSLLTHEEYFEKLSQYSDPCRTEKEFLLDLHRRSFPQWEFEFDQGFNICLYGFGSKRKLLHQFADWFYQKHSSEESSPSIIFVNGHTPNISIRSIFATIARAVLGSDLPSKLGSQPIEVLELLQSVLQTRQSQPQQQQRQQQQQQPITILLSSIDAPPLRRAINQALLARLAATPHVRLLATADTPNFLLMWDINLRDQYNLLFHDCTTFAPFDAEFDTVEDVHSLLGRRGRRIGGKEGVGFVLKSLPENAQNLYRLLLTELISMLDEGRNTDDEAEGDPTAANATASSNETGIEFRLLYQRATEEFIASSEMMFRTLLKEFHDHQMITSRMDASGMEILGVPLAREEMEGILEDLVLG